ncbi:hypothetical protein CsatB_025209 [Cannabis sativa]
MVYITSWDEFADRSLQMFRADPESCLKFKTDQAQDAKKMEKLNNMFFTLMARGPEADTDRKLPGKSRWMHSQPRKEEEGNNNLVS